MSNTANIENKTEYIVSRLVGFVEEDACQTLHGHELAVEIKEAVKEKPLLCEQVMLSMLMLYATRINQICKQYDGGLN